MPATVAAARMFSLEIAERPLTVFLVSSCLNVLLVRLLRRLFFVMVKGYIMTTSRYVLNGLLLAFYTVSRKYVDDPSYLYVQKTAQPTADFCVNWRDASDFVAPSLNIQNTFSTRGDIYL